MATDTSDYTIALESPETLSSYWRNTQSTLQWECFFVLPPWLNVWWREFGLGAKRYLCAVKHRGAVIGIAPLCLKGETACFVGSTNVCDCLDFVVVPGDESAFFNIILDDLSSKGITRLSLSPLRPDSTVLTHLVDIAKGRGHKASIQTTDVSLELNLPATWEDYLGVLKSKQRHEVRRKLRRLQEKGSVAYRTIEDSDDSKAAVNLFLTLFRKNNEKETFMTTKMESFFMSLTKTMAQANLLRMGVLELNANPIAVLLCFEYNGIVYLYNNGYDPEYSSLSVGLVSKILSIKDSIERGIRKYDFLKGGEAYKYRLGGKEVPLYDCQILLK
jgi:CelD/BcsL family acetyltransferase involved in cellulose biosynthesis